MTAPSTEPVRRLTPVVRLAPAKLNLTLAIVGHRPDGFHALHSVMVPLALADRLSMAINPTPGAADTLHVDGFDCGPVRDNLVLRAVAATRGAIGAGWDAPPGASGPPPGLAIRLDKRIPVAAGLAGGSSDAAAAIDGALEAWGADLGAGERHAVAMQIGSDVPFFLAGGPALVEGRGERVTPLHGVVHGSGPAAAQSDAPGILLVTPSVAAPTAAVFAAWAAGAMGEPGVVIRTSEHFASEFGSGLSVARLIERAGVLAAANDLAPAAASVVPGLVGLRRALARQLGRPIGLSGSGPTVWALYPSLGDAEAGAQQVRDGLDGGVIPAPGDAPPFVAATTILAQPGSDA